MHYRTTQQLSDAVSRWDARLPRDIDVIVGVPRSGLIPATLLALRRHVPLTDVDGFVEGRLLGGGARLAGLEAASYLATPRRALVVDDSIDSGRAMAAVRRRLTSSAAVGHDVLYSAVYASSRRSGRAVDHYYELVPRPRVFEWNILHHRVLAEACMDIDGVLCRDPTPQENDDGPRYADFVRTAPLIYRPSVRVGHLVSSRLEAYRDATERWLEVHGVQYGELHLLSGVTAEERVAQRLHARHKAERYVAVKASLFIESSEVEAREIANLASRPVFCTETRTMFYPGRHGSVRRDPSPTDRARMRAGEVRSAIHQRTQRVADLKPWRATE